jgi:radical SAM superfamily enzyme YgiQ (UPF0313 family)
MKPVHFVGITAEHKDDGKDFAPLAFAYLSAYLKSRLPFVRVSVAPDLDTAHGMQPDLLGISSTTVDFGIAGKIAERSKELRPDLPIVLGGVHIGLLPNTLPKAADVGIVGEGEQTFFELLNAFSGSRALDPTVIKEISGLCFHVGGSVQTTEARAPIDDLDSIGHPDRTLAENRGERAHIMASRGCPYRCSFCASKKFWGPYRQFSAKYVVEEVELLLEHGVKKIHFFDDVFVADKKRFSDVAAEIVRRGYNKHLEFSLAMRAETASDEIFETMTKMGVREVTFGAESGSKRILEVLKGDGADPAENQRLLDLAAKHGINATASFIQGTPGETGDDLMKTYDFLISNIRRRRLRYFEMHNLTPFPGTRFWDEAKTRSLVSESMDWERLRHPWETLYLNQEIPKASFYFFDRLNQAASKMVAINKRSIACVVADELSATAAKESGFFDLVVQVEESDDGLGVKGLEDLRTFADSEDGFLGYLPQGASDKVETLVRIIWFAHENESNFVLHGGYRHFAPVTGNELRMCVLSNTALKAVLPKLESNGLHADISEQVTLAGLTADVYRPDLDPFTPTGTTERYFTEMLSRDFKLDGYKRKRDERLVIVESRIAQKSEALPKREMRNRSLRNSRLGAFAAKNGLLSRIARYLLQRD